MSQSITALYSDKAAAGMAVEEILTQGIKRKNISVLMSDSTRGEEFAVEVNSKAPEGAVTGAVAGGSIGAIAAGLTAVGTIASTGGMGLVAAGPVLAGLAGAGAGAATGGVIGGLIGLGFDENEAKLVDEGIKHGSILIGADVPDKQVDQIKKTFESTGAEKVSTH